MKQFIVTGWYDNTKYLCVVLAVEEKDAKHLMKRYDYTRIGKPQKVTAYNGTYRFGNGDAPVKILYAFY